MSEKTEYRRLLAVINVYADDEQPGRYAAEVIDAETAAPGMVSAARWTATDPQECARREADHLCDVLTSRAAT